MLDSYRFLWKSEGVDVVLDRIHEDRDGLKCEMSISTSIAPSPGLLREGRFNLSAPTTRGQWQKALAERMPDVDWYAALEIVCAKATRRWRDGGPVIDLACVEETGDLPYLIPPFVVDGGGSVLFADGGTGKSLMALAMCASVATGAEILEGVNPVRLGRCLYLDWEWDEESHHERLVAICAGAGIDVPRDMIFYRHEVASIIEGAATIRRRIAELGVVFVVVDSLGMARGGEPESADLTIRTFQTLRTFGVPVLIIDHVAKHATDKSQSFGSVYTKNSARLMWRMDATKAEGSDRISVGLVNTKANRRLQRGRGFHIDMEADQDERLSAVRFTATDIRDVPGLAHTLTQKDQIIGVLRANGGRLMSFNEIAENLEGKTSPDAVRVTVKRHPKVFFVREHSAGLLEAHPYLVEA